MKVLGVILLSIAIPIALTAGLAVIVSWAWSLFAPSFNLPALSFLAAFGIIIVLMILVGFLKSVVSKSD